MKINQKTLSFPKPPEECVCGWEEIAKYTPYSEGRLRHRFGAEMKRKGVVWPMTRARIGGYKLCGFIWRIQRFFWLKGQKGELV